MRVEVEIIGWPVDGGPIRRVHAADPRTAALTCVASLIDSGALRGLPRELEVLTTAPRRKRKSRYMGLTLGLSRRSDASVRIEVIASHLSPICPGGQEGDTEGHD